MITFLIISDLVYLLGLSDLNDCIFRLYCIRFDKQRNLIILIFKVIFFNLFSIFLEPDDFYIKNVTLDENFCAVGHDEGYTKELAIEILLDIIKDNDQEINITEDEDDEELSTWMFWLYMAILPVVFIGGTIGNALAIFIMASKSLCKFSFSQYLIILAVFDVLLLLNLFLDWVAQISIVSSPLAYNLLAFRYGAVSSCMLYPFAVRICAFMSSWLVVAFSIDRCISVCYPFQSHRFCTPSVARIVALLIFIVGTMSQIYQPILEGESDDQFWVDRFLEYPCLFDKAEMENLADLQIFLEENDLSITSVNDDHECVTAFHFSESLTITTQQILLAFSRLVLFMILPFTIILISNVLIILEVKRSRKVVPKIADAHKQDDTSNSAERAMSLKLLSIPIVFLILAIPDSVFVIKDTINLARGQPIYTADQIDDFRYLTYMTNGINSAINFLLYAIAFRRRVFEELQSCCRCCRNA